jgi:polyhydroxyalkanoate synthase subunit PhaC
MTTPYYDPVEDAVGGGIATALDPLRTRDVARVVLRPRDIASAAPKLVADWAKVLVGLSEIDIPSQDAIYADSAWRDHPVFRRLAQGHLAWTSALESITEDTSADWRDRERARYVTNIITAALSPANFFPTNPVAVRRFIETGGRSALRGTRNLLRDVRRNKGMPSTVDTRPYKVGENLACTRGSVVYREEMFELLQYTPGTATVHERPLLFVPPELNKYYVLDLAPGRSMVEYAIAHGIQTFMVVWRNPRLDKALGHGNWGLEDYLAAHARAFDVVRAITGAADINLAGLCAGGMTSALTQAHLEASGSRPVNAATYLVTMLDARRPNMVTWMSTPDVGKMMTDNAACGTVIDSRAVAANFAWMRPKDLVFRYLINDWLLGEDPPSFDVLAWNSDATNMSSTFSRDSNALLASGNLVKPGGVTLLDTPIDLSAVTADAFIVAGQRDHITTWRPCYMTSQLLGGKHQFVLVNSGHIQSFVNPPESSRYMYWTAPADTADPDAWVETAERHQGSWWPEWITWLTERSGPQRPAATALGNAKYQPLTPAPGTYVFEK